MSTGRNQQVARKDSGAVEMPQDRPVFSPATDIIEHPDCIQVVCDMPGVDQEQVDLMLENDVLTIVGSQQHDDPDGYRLVYRGYGDGILRRVFTISADVDREGIQAQMKQGVLRITLPKAAEVQPRRIQIQSR